MDRYCGHENFDKAYLTNISIIQGVAFGFFANQLFEISIEDFSLVYCLHALISFFTIVTITYAYILLVIRTKWEISIFDFLIPYALGLSEIASFSNLYTNNWWFWNGILCCIAFAAYCNSMLMIKRCKKCNEDEYTPMVKRLRVNLILTPMFSLICFLNYLVYNHFLENLSLFAYFISVLVVMSYRVGRLPEDKLECE